MRKIYECGQCSETAAWVRRTQFSGDHYYCTAHAEQQEDFGKEDMSSFFWDQVVAEDPKPGEQTERVKKLYQTPVGVALGLSPRPLG